MFNRLYKIEDLDVLYEPDTEESAKISFGDLVQLNSGGPILTVVDIEHDQITVAWRDKAQIAEITLPRMCFSPLSHAKYLKSRRLYRGSSSI